MRIVVLAAFLLAASACSSSGDTSVGTVASSPVSTSSTSISTTSAATASSTSTSTSTSSTSTTVGAVDCGLLRGGGSAIDIDGTGRAFNSYVPDDIGLAGDDGSIQRPTLVLLHGFSGNAGDFATTTGLDVLAPAAGVNLVAPQGEGEVPTWNIGGADNALAVNDIAFLDQLLDGLADSPCVDATNIWLAGFSAGSAYTGVYGCTHADRLAGLAMVSGLPPALCPDDATISIQITHGTDDAVVPFGGGDQAVADDASVDLGSVPSSSAGWAERAGCGAPSTSVFGDTNPSEVTAWGTCRGGAKVSLLAVNGLNHVWAGGASPDFLEPISPIVNAGCVILTTMTASSDTPFDACFGPWPS